MLNRFKNVIDGTSTSNSNINDNNSNNRPELIRASAEQRDSTLFSKLFRSALTRSSSFREDLLGDSIRFGERGSIGNNGSNHHQSHNTISHSKSLMFNGTPAATTISNGNHNSASKPTNNNDTINQHQSNSRTYPRPTAQKLSQIKQGGTNKISKYPYSRPEFLQLRNEDEVLVSADHQIRPIILPRDVTRLPWKSGYAECINAGKSRKNEDQASNYQDVIVRKCSHLDVWHENYDDPDDYKIPWYYFGIFDGHAGAAVAVAAATQLHNIISEKLRLVADLLIDIEFVVNNFDDYSSSDENADDNYNHGNGDKAEKDNDDDNNNKPSDVQQDKQADNSNSVDRENTKSALNPSQSQSNISPNSTDTCTQQQLPSRQSDRATRAKLESSDVHEMIDVNTISSSTSDDDADDMDQEDNDDDDKYKSSVELMVRESSTRKGIRAPRTTTNTKRTRPYYTEPQYSSLNWLDLRRNDIDTDVLIRGLLEESFWQMDAMIEKDKNLYKMRGGCTAIVSLFIFGRLYVCNAGDSRAMVYKNGEVIPMSFDFTPVSERDRILRLALDRPEYLGNEFTHLEFIDRPTRDDLGKQMLYRDAYMTGWSMKTITYEDLKLPLVSGQGKRSRLLATIGVTRGFGDHELRTQYGSLLIKPFLTPEPEVRVLRLDSREEQLSEEDVLIMGTDGLWDVTSNQDAAKIVKFSFDRFQDSEETRAKYRYMTAAQDLVIHARSHSTNWRGSSSLTGASSQLLAGERFVSFDDIAAFVIPLKQYRDEYAELKRSLRRKRSARNRTDDSKARRKNHEQEDAGEEKDEQEEQKTQREWWQSEQAKVQVPEVAAQAPGEPEMAMEAGTVAQPSTPPASNDPSEAASAEEGRESVAHDRPGSSRSDQPAGRPGV